MVVVVVPYSDASLSRLERHVVFFTSDSGLISMLEGKHTDADAHWRDIAGVAMEKKSP